MIGEGLFDQNLIIKVSKAFILSSPGKRAIRLKLVSMQVAINHTARSFEVISTKNTGAVNL